MPVWLMENVELLKSRDGIQESYSDGVSDEDETWLPSVAATGRSSNSPNKVKDNGRAKFLGTG